MMYNNNYYLDKHYATIAIQDRLDGGKKKLNKLLKRGNIGSLHEDNYETWGRKERRDLRLKLKAKARLGTITDREKKLLYTLSVNKMGNQGANAGAAIVSAMPGPGSVLGAAHLIGGQIGHKLKSSKWGLRRDMKRINKREKDQTRAKGFANREREKHLIDLDTRGNKTLRKLKTHLRTNKSWGKEDYKKAGLLSRLRFRTRK